MMLAMKNSSSSSSNRCRVCPKVFCCSECRDNHENNKHAELNSSQPKCPLCFKFDLPYDPRILATEDNIERAQLVCHLVFNHLPLRCKICGDKFETDQSFQTALPCKGPIKKPRVPKQPTTSSIGTPCESNNNDEDIIIPSSEKKLPLTPNYYIEAGVANKSLSSVGSLRLQHQDNFDSPPELSRQTSTPMHLSVVSLQKQHSQPPSIPDFNLKTPSSAQRPSFESTGSTCGSGSAFESRYYTAGIDEHLMKLSLEGNNNTRRNYGTPIWNSPVIPILKKKLEKQSSGEDSPTNSTSYRVEHSILKSALLSRIDDSTRDSIEKRVRFSDQFLPPASTAITMADTSACDNDVFFEARDSLDEDEREIKQNNSPVIKEVEKKVQSPADSTVGESKTNISTASNSSSSRVVMMLLVEKTDDAKGLSSLDLGPLIDSGLKKLEESAASINNSNSEKGNHDSSSTGTIAKVTTEVTSYTRELDGSLTQTSKGCRRRASIKDTFMAVTDRIECITPPPRRRNQDVTEDQERELANKADSLIGAHKNHDGLFSVVARVVRSAWKKLPVTVTARNLSREPIPTNQNSTPVTLVTAADSHATAIVRRSSIKRPRERNDSHDEAATLRDSPESNSSTSSSSISSTSSLPTINYTNITTNNTVSNELVVTSPAAKRHRGWYRIRGREPIARMRERQVVAGSPRGASRETQRFQQGALSIGDTFLPLPSRAHQSTQTED